MAGVGVDSSQQTMKVNVANITVHAGVLVQLLDGIIDGH